MQPSARRWPWQCDFDRADNWDFCRSIPAKFEFCKHDSNSSNRWQELHPVHEPTFLQHQATTPQNNMSRLLKNALVSPFPPLSVSAPSLIFTTVFDRKVNNQFQWVLAQNLLQMHQNRKHAPMLVNGPSSSTFCLESFALFTSRLMFSVNYIYKLWSCKFVTENKKETERKFGLVDVFENAIGVFESATPILKVF